LIRIFETKDGRLFDAARFCTSLPKADIALHGNKKEKKHV